MAFTIVPGIIAAFSGAGSAGSGLNTISPSSAGFRFLAIAKKMESYIERSSKKQINPFEVPIPSGADVKNMVVSFPAHLLEGFAHTVDLGEKAWGLIFGPSQQELLQKEVVKLEVQVKERGEALDTLKKEVQANSDILNLLGVKLDERSSMQVQNREVTNRLDQAALQFAQTVTLSSSSVEEIEKAVTALKTEFETIINNKSDTEFLQELSTVGVLLQEEVDATIALEKELAALNSEQAAIQKKGSQVTQEIEEDTQNIAVSVEVLSGLTAIILNSPSKPTTPIGTHDRSLQTVVVS